MAEMAISFVIFGILLIIALVIIFFMWPKLVSVMVTAVKEIVTQIGKAIARSIPIIGNICGFFGWC